MTALAASAHSDVRETVFLATTACQGCGACLRTCPNRALRPSQPGMGAPILTLVQRCTGCGECAEVCPADAFLERPA